MTSAYCLESCLFQWFFLFFVIYMFHFKFEFPGISHESQVIPWIASYSRHFNILCDFIRFIHSYFLWKKIHFFLCQYNETHFSMRQYGTQSDKKIYCIRVIFIFFNVHNITMVIVTKCYFFSSIGHNNTKFVFLDHNSRNCPLQIMYTLFNQNFKSQPTAI